MHGHAWIRHQVQASQHFDTPVEVAQRWLRQCKTYKNCELLTVFEKPPGAHDLQVVDDAVAYFSQLIQEHQATPFTDEETAWGLSRLDCNIPSGYRGPSNECLPTRGR